MEQARTFDLDELKKQVDKDDYVTLYHGTNTSYLNSILENGILPRNETGNNNWRREEALANENIVYLTNKWHYWYAYNSVEFLLEQKYGEDWSDKEEGRWWRHGNIVPIYLECRIPKALLTVDEDLIYSKFVKDELKKAVRKGTDIELNISWEDCLAHHGTAGVRGGVPKEYIHAIHILGDGQLYLDLMEDNRPYKKDFRKWMNGKGKGKLKSKELKAMEQKYKYVGSLPVTAIPKGYKLSECYYNKEHKTMSFVANTPKEYMDQPRKLEIF